MKKILVLMIAVFAMSMTANAQKLSDDERERVIENMISHMKKWGKWYITVTPVTWYEYWAVTGVKKHAKNVSVSKAAIVGDADQRKFCDVLNKEAGKTFFMLMTKTEMFDAHHQAGLHDDVSYISFDHGFYVKMSVKNYEFLRGQ